jgi:hypothetical protein
MDTLKIMISRTVSDGRTGNYLVFRSCCTNKSMLRTPTLSRLSGFVAYLWASWLWQTGILSSCGTMVVLWTPAAWSQPGQRAAQTLRYATVTLPCRAQPPWNTKTLRYATVTLPCRAQPPWNTKSTSYTVGKSKSKVHPRIGHERGPDGE